MPSTSQPLRSTADRAARVASNQRSSAPGRLGPWDLVRAIAEGPLATIYEARPAGGPGQQPGGYAIKVLRGQWQDDPIGLAILAREVQVGRQVTHPHLVPILAAGLNEPPYYLAMPLLEGRSLAALLHEQQLLDLPMAFWIARQAAEAIDALYQAGWMHGDVKPSNILVSSSGHVTLIDLGFARHTNERNVIADRPILGTIHYIAPEMIYSALGGDIRSDVYSLGVTLFEILTGRVPFDAEDVAELAAQHRQELPGDLRSLVPHLPTRAARLVHHMLAKEPLRRPMPRDVVERLAALEIETFAERFTGQPDD